MGLEQSRVVSSESVSSRPFLSHTHPKNDDHYGKRAYRLVLDDDCMERIHLLR